MYLTCTNNVLFSMPKKIDQPELNLDTESDDYFLDDSTFTFRVNSQLKDDFKKLCSRDRYSSASVIKRWMLKAVRDGRINNNPIF